MSDPVMITLIVCFTVIFVCLVFAIVIRWLCIVTLNSHQQAAELDDKYLTIDEFQEFEHIVSEALNKLEHRDPDKENKNDR